MTPEQQATVWLHADMNTARITILMAMGILWGCSTQTNPSQTVRPGWHLYANDRYGYEIQYPDGYDLWETGAQGERDGASIRIGLHEYEAMTPMLDLEVQPRVEMQDFPTLGTQLQDLSVQIENRIVNGMQAKEADYHWTETGELAFAEIYVEGVIIRFTALSGMPDFHGTEWWAIISTFRFRNR